VLSRLSGRITENQGALNRSGNARKWKNVVDVLVMSCLAGFRIVARADLFVLGSNESDTLGKNGRLVVNCNQDPMSSWRVVVHDETSHGLQALTQLALVMITLVVPCGLLRR
jgi:hypothetical protein